MKYLTTGEFARFCGTSKDTLIFYDRQDILKPRHVSGNGYRRYLPEQFYEFDLISILKDTGSSLAEIKGQMRQGSPEQILALLEEKKHILKKESERLAMRRVTLEEMSHVIAEASRIKYDVLSFEELAEERLALAETETEFDMESDDGFLAQYRSYFADRSDMPKPVLYGVLINEQNLTAKRYVASCFFHKAYNYVDEKLHIMSAGRYAILAHRGTTASHVKAYHQIINDIEKAALTIISPMYIYNLMNNITNPNIDEYAAKYCVRVQ